MFRCPVTFAQGGKRPPKAAVGGDWRRSRLGGEVWRGGGALFTVGNFKFRFKKATKSAHFSSLRRVSDDFCTALYRVARIRVSH